MIWPGLRYLAGRISRDELKAAVDQYVQGYWGTAESTKFGWPIGSWCVEKVTDMSELFKDLSTFNEDISGWEVGMLGACKGEIRRLVIPYNMAYGERGMPPTIPAKSALVCFYTFS